MFSYYENSTMCESDLPISRLQDIVGADLKDFWRVSFVTEQASNFERMG